jgi:glycerol uptake facilitator-like aquaporin
MCVYVTISSRETKVLQSDPSNYMVMLCPRSASDCNPIGLVARTFIEEFVCTFAFVNFVLMIKYHSNS